jgi:hypothetical protein
MNKHAIISIMTCVIFLYQLIVVVKVFEDMMDSQHDEGMDDRVNQ